MSSESSVKALESWLNVWAMLVALGVTFEMINDWPKLVSIVRTLKRIDWIAGKYRWTWPSAESPDNKWYDGLLTSLGILGTVLIIIGLVGELRTQSNLSTVQHNIRVGLYGQVRSANDRATNASNRAAIAETELIIVSNPRRIPVSYPQINELKPFAGSPIFIQAVDESEPKKQLPTDLVNVFKAAGWIGAKVVTQRETDIASADIPEAISLWTIQPFDRISIPRAHALAEYVTSSGMLINGPYAVGINAGKPIWPFDKFKSVPSLDSILVLIGTRDPMLEIREWRMGLLPVPWWVEP